MSGLFSTTPIVTMPSFLKASAPTAATLNGMSAGLAPRMGGETWAPAQSVALLGMEQELQRIRTDIDQILASIEAALPPSVPSALGQAWQSVTQFLFGQPAPAAPSPGGSEQPVPTKPKPTKFVLSSFNLLSSSAGKSKGYAPGTSRMHDAVKILKTNEVSVVGFQEMAADQLAEFKKIAGDEYGTFAGSSGIKGYLDTTIAWRKDTWKLVSSDSITVPSYAGRDSEVPYVRLRNKQTGQEAYFLNAHNPANTKRYHNQDRFRNEAARLEAALVKKLMKDTGLPVFVVGDMNSVGEARDIFTQGAPIKAANPAGKTGIDWIFGSKDVHFSGFRRERNDMIRRTTDHPVLFSNVRIGEA